jgi:hypothetical protein
MTDLQIEELNVTATAPLRDPIEVLIEEVRQQARSRSWRNLALVVVALVVGLEIYLASSGHKGSLPTKWTAPLAPGMPTGIASAVNGTLAVQSVEMIESDDPGAAIYQAPDLYAARQLSPPGVWATWYISGSAEFYAVPRNWGQALVRQFPGLVREKKDARSAAQQTAFQTLLNYLPFASDFVRIGDTYTFRLSIPRANTLPRYARGNITISNSFVVSVILENLRSTNTTWPSGTEPSGPVAVETLTTRYEHFDDNPHLVTPSLKTPWCLQRAGSLVLNRCIWVQPLP